MIFFLHIGGMVINSKRDPRCEGKGAITMTTERQKEAGQRGLTGHTKATRPCDGSLHNYCTTLFFLCQESIATSPIRDFFYSHYSPSQKRPSAKLGHNSNNNQMVNNSY